MNLVITLNATTYAQVAGWVKYYQDHPELVGIPNTAPAPPWNGQTKIVLNDTSRELFEQIEAQFAMPVMPIDIAPEFKRGDPRFVFDAYPNRITAIPFQLGPGPFTVPNGYASSAEIPVPGQQPAMRYAALSRTAGDMSNQTTPGKQVTIDFTADELGEGIWYFNTYLAPEYGVTSSSFSVNFPH